MKKVVISSLLTVVALSSLAGVSNAAQVGSAAKSKASVDFTTGNENPKPYDPSKPDGPVTEVEERPTDQGKGTTGQLRFDRVPTFAFETITIGDADQKSNVLQESYTVKGTSETFYSAPSLEISDIRGSNTGWSVLVKKDAELKSSTTTTPAITGYKLTLAKGVVRTYSEGNQSGAPVFKSIEIGTETNACLNAAAGSGGASWALNFFDESVASEVGEDAKTGSTVKVPVKNTTDTPTASSAVTLEIPQGATMKTGETYSTNLTWILSDDPSATTTP